MKCPYCGYLESKIIDSRYVEEGDSIRRRRECIQCDKRFTTYERLEDIPIIVRKRDGAREVFDRNKLLDGLIRAAEKRQISLQALQGLVEEVEREMRNLGREVSTDEIAGILLVKLRRLDEVVYVRYASVFHKYQKIEDFKEELDKMISLREKEKEGEFEDQGE